VRTTWNRQADMVALLWRESLDSVNKATGGPHGAGFWAKEWE
jgi:hypothetical protein